MFNKVEQYIENFLVNKSDKLIVDIMKNKLKVKVVRKDDNITFDVRYGGAEISSDSVDVSCRKCCKCVCGNEA